jgi:putative transposase
MTRRRTYDRERHAHFVTSSCFRRRRRLLDHDRSNKVVLGVRNSQLALRRGKCIGVVVRPDHVPAILHLPDPDPIRRFMKPWEQRSSVRIKRLLRGTLSSEARDVDLSEPVWQARYRDLDLFSAQKVEEERIDLHQDPVRAGLAAHPCDGPWSSARYDEQGRTVGVAVGWLDWALLRLRRRDNKLSRPPAALWRRTSPRASRWRSRRWTVA